MSRDHLHDHLGDRVAALVDGELDHGTRDRLLAHLAHCAPCRTEVDAQRRLKATLTDLGSRPPLPPDALTARLLALPAEVPARPGPVRASLPRGPRRPGGLPRTARRAARPPARPGLLPRRGAAAGALVVLGLAGALALGTPRASGPAAPLDPASDVFVADFVTAVTQPVPAPTGAALLAPVDRPVPGATLVPGSALSPSPSPSASPSAVLHTSGVSSPALAGVDR